MTVQVLGKGPFIKFYILRSGNLLKSSNVRRRVENDWPQNTLTIMHNFKQYLRGEVWLRL
jgi:hypothetical protein